MANKLPAAEQINGFSKLPLQVQKIFAGFLTNFYNAFEFPEDHEIVKVSIAKESSESFIKVQCANKEWFHVTSVYNWY